VLVQAPTEKQRQPHLRPFDFLRVLFCLMVVSHHVMFYIAAVRADEPRLTAAWQHSPLLNFANSAGFPAVDGFFLISGFFTTWSLIQRKSEFSMAQCLVGVLATEFRHAAH